jgi:hypothetical protein
MSSPRKVQP